MIPQAYISHQIPHRARIRVPAKRNDRAYFSKVEKEFGKLKGVVSVQVQPLTGSVLIEHHGPLRALIDFSREKELFELIQAKPVEPWVERLLSNVADWDNGIRSGTQGQWDLSSLVAAGLLGAGLYQAMRRNIFPPAWSLLGDAIELMKQSKKQHEARKSAA